jgi:hypothetical protein
MHHDRRKPRSVGCTVPLKGTTGPTACPTLAGARWMQSSGLDALPTMHVPADKANNVLPLTTTSGSVALHGGHSARTMLTSSYRSGPSTMQAYLTCGVAALTTARTDAAVAMLTSTRGGPWRSWAAETVAERLSGLRAPLYLCLLSDYASLLYQRQDHTCLLGKRAKRACMYLTG